MGLWRAFLLWNVQLLLIGGLAQFYAWLYAIDVDFQAFTAAHRDLVTIGLVAYYACFAIFSFARRDLEALRRFSKREADDDR